MGLEHFLFRLFLSIIYLTFSMHSFCHLCFSLPSLATTKSTIDLSTEMWFIHFFLCLENQSKLHWSHTCISYTRNMAFQLKMVFEQGDAVAIRWQTRTYILMIAINNNRCVVKMQHYLCWSTLQSNSTQYSKESPMCSIYFFDLLSRDEFASNTNYN